MRVVYSYYHMVSSNLPVFYKNPMITGPYILSIQNKALDMMLKKKGDRE